MMSYSLKSLISWVMFALGIFAVVYAGNLALSELGNKVEWDKLTLSMWNSLISRVDEKLDQASVSTEVSLWNSDESVPSQNAVKTYVDAQVGAAGSGENYVVYWQTCQYNNYYNSPCAPICLSGEISIWQIFVASSSPSGANGSNIVKAQQCVKKIVD